jgi:hypothetical protein
MTTTITMTTKLMMTVTPTKMTAMTITTTTMTTKLMTTVTPTKTTTKATVLTAMATDDRRQ